MSSESLSVPESPPEKTFECQVGELQAEWKQEAKSLARLASAVAPLSRSSAFEDLKKLEATIRKVEVKVESIPYVADRGRDVVQRARAEIERRKKNMRTQLSSSLHQACRSVGLTLRVIRREPPIEVRVPPFAVVIDWASGVAEIRFALRTIERCAADAEAIVAAHSVALKTMTSGFDSERFFSACRTAWISTRRTSGDAEANGRVELVDFLPRVAMEMQPRAFRVDPVAKNFRGYSRARFAFDLNALRKTGGLTRDGWRLNLGVATGTSASKKNRTIFVEDENGNGEHKLTVFFTRTES